MKPLLPSFPRRTSLDRPIRTNGIVLVEGRSAEILLRELIERDLALKQHVEARDFGEKESANIKNTLSAFATTPEFRSMVLRLGIIRDAEDGAAQDAFADVVRAIKDFNLENPSQSLPVPTNMAVLTPLETASPQVAVFILPDCYNQGMMETLCLDAIEEVENDPKTAVMPCVDSFFNCIEKQGRKPRNQTKARFAGFALAQDVIDPQLGRAAQKGSIPWHAKAFDPLKSFVQTIAGI